MHPTTHPHIHPSNLTRTLYYWTSELPHIAKAVSQSVCSPHIPRSVAFWSHPEPSCVPPPSVWCADHMTHAAVDKWCTLWMDTLHLKQASGKSLVHHTNGARLWMDTLHHKQASCKSLVHHTNGARLWMDTLHHKQASCKSLVHHTNGAHCEWIHSTTNKHHVSH